MARVPVYLMLPRDLLSDYQCKGVRFLLNHSRAAVWDDMGLGKTITTLTALVDLMDRWDVSRVLIVSHKRVAHTTWPAEITKWDHTHHLAVAVIKGTAKQRTITTEYDRSEVHTISETSLVWLEKHYKGRNVPYDALVIDESCLFKNPKAGRTKAMMSLVKHNKFSFIWQLSATPAAERYHELWPQMFILDRGRRLGKTRSWFTAFFFERYDPTVLKPNADTAINKRVSDIVIRRRAGDYIDVPELVETTVPLKLSCPVMRRYDVARACLIDEEEGVSLHTLRQIANGRLLAEDGDERIHDVKLDALSELIETIGQPVLIPYSYVADCEVIRERFPDAKLLDDDPNTIASWNDKQIPILLMHPKAGGHGLNLQDGGNHIIWYSPEWSLRLHLQTNGRLHRQGQTRPVIAQTLVAKDTIDEIILASRQWKFVNQAKILEGVRQAALKRANQVKK